MDTREQDKHIKKELESNGYEVKKQTFSYGDYSFIHSGNNYTRKFVIERKKNFDEIIGNINSEKNSRFYKEFERARRDSAEIVIIVEQTKNELINKKYRSSFAPVDVYNMLQTFIKKYNIKLIMLSRDKISEAIINLFNDEIQKSESN